MLKKLALILMLIGLAGFMPPWGPPGQPLAAAAAAGDPGQAPSTRVARLEHDLEQAVARVQPVFDRYGYLAVFLAILVEGVGIPAPGQTLLIAAALSAAHGKLSLVWVLIWACLAAGLGNSLGYLLGRWGGRHQRSCGSPGPGRGLDVDLAAFSKWIRNRLKRPKPVLRLRRRSGGRDTPRIRKR